MLAFYAKFYIVHERYVPRRDQWYEAFASAIEWTAFFHFMTNKFMLGTKGRMTQVFNEDGTVKAATVVTAGPLKVTQVKTVEIDGYKAVQVGFGDRREKNVNKPQLGHLKDLGTFMHLREFRLTEGFKTPLERGQSIDVSAFVPGDIITVSAITKGKGFQGGVKLHGFKGAPRSHGHKQSERRPGSIGMRWPQRVIKGKRMAGRMGGDMVTVKNLKVLQVDIATNTLVISGAIPGKPGALIEIIA